MRRNAHMPTNQIEWLELWEGASKSDITAKICNVDKTNDQETNMFHIFKPYSRHLGRNFSSNRLQMLPNQIVLGYACQFLKPALGNESQLWLHQKTTNIIVIGRQDTRDSRSNT